MKFIVNIKTFLLAGMTIALLAVMVGCEGLCPHGEQLSSDHLSESVTIPKEEFPEGKTTHAFSRDTIGEKAVKVREDSLEPALSDPFDYQFPNIFGVFTELF